MVGRLGIGAARRGVAPRCVRPGAGLAGGAGCGGVGAELAHVLWRTTPPEVVAGQGCETEVATDFGDDLGDGTGMDVVVQVGGVEALAKLGAEGFGGIAGAGALDCVLDLADDAPAGGGALLGRVVAGRRRGFVEAAREGDAAADGAGDAVEGAC